PLQTEVGYHRAEDRGRARSVRTGQSAAAGLAHAVQAAATATASPDVMGVGVATGGRGARGSAASTDGRAMTARAAETVVAGARPGGGGRPPRPVDGAMRSTNGPVGAGHRLRGSIAARCLVVMPARHKRTGRTTRRSRRE